MVSPLTHPRVCALPQALRFVLLSRAGSSAWRGAGQRRYVFLACLWMLLRPAALLKKMRALPAEELMHVLETRQSVLLSS